MTVRKEAPISFFGTLDEELESFLGLTFTKGDRVNLDTLLFGELVNDIGGVNTLSQYHNDWLAWLGCRVDFRNLSSLRGNELLRLERGQNVVLDCKDDTIGSEASEQDHLSERVFAFGFPLSWKLGLLRLWLL